MKKSLPRLVLLGLAATVGVAAFAIPATATSEGEVRGVTNGAEVVPGRYIVKLADQVGIASAEDTAAELADSFGGDVRHTFGAAFGGFSAEMSQRQARRLAASPEVEYVQQVYRVQIAGTQDDPPNWGVDRIDQRDLPLDDGFTYPDDPGAGVHVYVMDTGINADHVDFSGRMAAGKDFVDNDNNPSDCHGHGTHVAGTAAGTAYGVAKKATVHGIRVLDCRGSGGNDDIIAAIDWVRENAVRPAVVNYSIGCRSRCPSDPAMEQAVKDLIASGVQFVQAAGNSDDDACYYSPQHVGVAVTVGNSTSSDRRRFDSNYGTCVDLFAPGTDIVSAAHNSDTGSATMSGTSMASPHVAGAAAVYLGLHPQATPAQVQDALVDNASVNKIGDAQGTPNRLLYTGFMASAEPGQVAVAAPGDQRGTVGEPVSLTLRATGGTAPYTWSATGLPAGLSIDSATGTVSGAPTTVGTSTVTIAVTDSESATAETTFGWTVGETGGTCAPVTNGDNVTIRDLTTVESALTVSGCAGDASATSTVELNIVHSWRGDLVIDLVAPDGSTYRLKNAAGGDSADNVTGTVEVDLSGERADGTWKLRVRDTAWWDTGYIDSWTLTV